MKYAIEGKSAELILNVKLVHITLENELVKHIIL